MLDGRIANEARIRSAELFIIISYPTKIGIIVLLKTPPSIEN